MKKTKRKSSVMEITLDFGVLGELEVEVDYVYTPGERATMYTANGDPGDPGSDPEVEILAVYIKASALLGCSTMTAWWSMRFSRTTKRMSPSAMTQEARTSHAKAHANAAPYAAQCRHPRGSSDSARPQAILHARRSRTPWRLLKVHLPDTAGSALSPTALRNRNGNRAL